MTPREVKALLKILRRSGVTHYKTPELELALEATVSRETKPKLKSKSDNLPTVLEHKDDEEEKIRHKDEELSSLLKLSDVELVDRLFPDHTNEEGEESTHHEAN